MAAAGVIYTRISRDAEGEQVGVDRQRVDCIKLAERLGVEVLKVFTDNDTGASLQTKKSKVRHSYKEMIDLVREGGVTHIISYSNSRLTRRMAELEDLIQLSEKTGVQIHTVVSGNDDLSTADGQMVARIKASVDAAEAKRISERMKAALRHKAQSGEPRVTSHRPFGWLPDGKTLDPVEAPFIREAVEDLLAGVPLNHIKKRWESLEVKTPSGGSIWHWSTLYNVLTSWRIAGFRTYNGELVRDENGEPVVGAWTPIITLEEREKLLLQFKARSLTKKRSGKYLLSGLLRCGECGMSMWGSTKAGKHKNNQYVCSSGTGHVSIDAGKLETVMLLELYAHLINRQMKQDSAIQIQPAQPWEGQERLAAVTKQIEELLSAFRSELLSGEIVFPQIQSLERERDELRRERDLFLSAQASPERQIKTGEDISSFMHEADSLPWERKQAVLRQELETVVIQKGVRGVRSRDKEVFRSRVRIVWKPTAG